MTGSGTAASTTEKSQVKQTKPPTAQHIPDPQFHETLSSEIFDVHASTDLDLLPKVPISEISYILSFLFTCIISQEKLEAGIQSKRQGNYLADPFGENAISPPRNLNSSRNNSPDREENEKKLPVRLGGSPRKAMTQAPSGTTTPAFEREGKFNLKNVAKIKVVVGFARVSISSLLLF